MIKEENKIYLYNTLTRKKEVFKPIKKGQVGIYSCGPTVYSYQHIGNLRTSINNDILKRLFLINRYKVTHITNVTDVGHLTSDADTGEDKMERAATKEGKTAKEISEFYFKAFQEDLEEINIISPTKWPKATQHIKEQIELIKILEKKGYTYKTSDGIYFDTSKFKAYGKFAKLNIKDLKAGKRIGLGEKKNKTDFALWKFAEEWVKRQQEWDSPWGIGFPGWHIECSAMSAKYLGKQIDVHTGGQEHIPIHHTNEIAQSEAGFGKKPFVNYWIHFAWLLFNNEKISKSKGNTYLLSDLEENNYDPLSFRYLCLTTHYKKPLNFSFEILDHAQNAYKRLKNIVLEIKKAKDKKDDKKINEQKTKFLKIINDDLNSPNGLAFLWDVVRSESLNNSEKYELVEFCDKFFGLNLTKEEKISIPSEIKKLVEEREKARKEKNWNKADELREKINKLGFAIEDKEEGTVIKKK